jgi:hypothetical protein
MLNLFYNLSLGIQVSFAVDGILLLGSLSILKALLEVSLCLH